MWQRKLSHIGTAKLTDQIERTLFRKADHMFVFKGVAKGGKFSVGHRHDEHSIEVHIWTYLPYQTVCCGEWS